MDRMQPGDPAAPLLRARQVRRASAAPSPPHAEKTRCQARGATPVRSRSHPARHAPAAVAAAARQGTCRTGSRCRSVARRSPPSGRRASSRRSAPAARECPYSRRNADGLRRTVADGDAWARSATPTPPPAAADRRTPPRRTKRRRATRRRPGSAAAPTSPASAPVGRGHRPVALTTRAGAADRPPHRWSRRTDPPAGSPQPAPASRSRPDGRHARSPRRPAPARSPRSPTWSHPKAAASSSAPAAPFGRNPCAQPGRPASPSASRRDRRNATPPWHSTGPAHATRCSSRRGCADGRRPRPCNPRHPRDGTRSGAASSCRSAH